MKLHLVYSIASGATVRHVGVVSLSEVVSLDRSASTMTIHHAFNDIEAANTYRKQLTEHFRIGSKRYKRSSVECVTTGTIYENAAAAARSMGLSRAALSLHLNHPERYKTAGGFVFRRIKQ